MSHVVLDTNVAVVANRRADHADPSCVRACLDALAVVREQTLLLDDGRRILREYLDNLSSTGQPGAGDAFVKWVLTVQADPRHCRTIPITPLRNHPDDFEEFPRDAALADFDRSDRKFVAVALASGLHPPILNAVDSDWRDHGAALQRHGVQVRFLCPHLVAAPA